MINQADFSTRFDRWEGTVSKLLFDYGSRKRVIGAEFNTGNDSPYRHSCEFFAVVYGYGHSPRPQ
jgi:hypothetical protein